VYQLLTVLFTQITWFYGLAFSVHSLIVFICDLFNGVVSSPELGVGRKFCGRLRQQSSKGRKVNILNEKIQDFSAINKLLIAELNKIILNKRLNFLKISLNKLFLRLGHHWRKVV
jgi:hypothetical protein